jgi:hypothetical protein
MPCVPSAAGRQRADETILIMPLSSAFARQSSRGMPAASSTCRQPWRLHALGRCRHPRATIVMGQGPRAELDDADSG